LPKRTVRGDCAHQAPQFGTLGIAASEELLGMLVEGAETRHGFCPSIVRVLDRAIRRSCRLVEASFSDQSGEFSLELMAQFAARRMSNCATTTTRAPVVVVGAPVVVPVDDDRNDEFSALYAPKALACERPLLTKNPSSRSSVFAEMSGKNR
jgi:hypothetical protein